MNSIESDSNQYRTFWPRLGAAFLDGAALAPLGWIDRLIWNSFSFAPILLSWITFYLAISVAYSVGFVAVFGQTPGKMACGIKIMGNDHSPVTLKQAFMRHSVSLSMSVFFLVLQIKNVLNGQLENRGYGNYQTLIWVGGAMIVWGIMEFVTMLTNKRRRAIHDFIGGTVVVRDSGPKKAWLPYLLILFFVLNFVVPHFITDTNMVVGARKR
jgi:uncharacterized RDD family membrane protein YckC